jgi:hypothetical protein
LHVPARFRWIFGVDGYALNQAAVGIGDALGVREGAAGQQGQSEKYQDCLFHI